MDNEFIREERYIVLKIKDMGQDKTQAIREILKSASIDTVECVVVEHDWPEYEKVWKMIEDRVNHNTNILNYISSSTDPLNFVRVI